MRKNWLYVYLCDFGSTTASDRFQRPDHHVFFDGEEVVAENPTQSSSVPLKKKSPYVFLLFNFLLILLAAGSSILSRS